MTRERDNHEADPDQRPPRMNADGGHKKRHVSELYDSRGAAPGGNGGGRTNGASQSIMRLSAVPSIREGRPTGVSDAEVEMADRA